MRQHSMVGAILLLLCGFAPHEGHAQYANENGQMRALGFEALQGDRSSARITNGRVVDTLKYPWQAALLEHQFLNPLNAAYCAGVLLDEYRALTAAHCIRRELTNGSVRLMDKTEIDVLIGVLDLLQGTRNSIADLKVYPKYDRKTHEGDLAILRLQRPVRQPAVTLITRDAASHLARPGQLAVVSGWGATEEGGDMVETLMETDVPIVSTPDCRKAYPNAITVTMICAGAPKGGHDACQGDSGSQLLVPAASGPYHLLAIVSWGEGCGRKDRYGVYTAILPFTDWISSTLAERS